MQTGVKSPYLPKSRATIVCSIYLLLVYASIFFQRPVFHVDYYFLGLDFRDFFMASQRFLEGRNPYEVSRFVTPPFSLLHGAILNPLGFSVARYVFFWVNVAIFLVVTLYMAIKGRQQKDVIYLLVFVYGSFPVQMLIDRGNVDGIVFLFTAACLFSKRIWIAALTLACGIMLKIYPIVLFLQLWMKHRTRFLLFFIFFISLLAICFSQETLQYIPNITRRTTEMRFTENISPHGLIYAISSSLSDSGGSAEKYNPEFVYSLAALYLCLMIYTDISLVRRRFLCVHGALSGASYIPLVLFFPTLVYAYTGVLLLLLILTLDYYEPFIKRARLFNWLIAAEVGVMFPSTAFNSATDIIMFDAIPQISVLAICIITIIIKWHISKSGLSREDPDTQEVYSLARRDQC